MKFNVHFHILVIYGSVDIHEKRVDFDYFLYDALRKVWLYQVLCDKDYLPKTRKTLN